MRRAGAARGEDVTTFGEGLHTRSFCHVDDRIDVMHPRKRKPDIALATSKLGWQPEVSPDDGLTETIARFKKLLAT